MRKLVALGLIWCATSAQADSQPAWEIIKSPAGAVVAKLTGPADPIKSMVVTCLDGQPSMIVKLAPTITKPEVTMGIQFPERERVTFKRYQATDGFILRGVPASVLELIASPGAPALRIDGQSAGRASPINARAAIQAAVASCATNASPLAAKPAVGFDIRGIKLGMTLPQVQAAVAASGFPTALKTIPDSTWRPLDSRIQRYKPYDRKDMEFDSIFATTKRSTPGNWRYTDRIDVAFLPPPNGHTAWAVAQYTTYAPGTGPGAKPTVAALVQKYGQPSWNMNGDFRVQAGSVQLRWSWDSNGRQFNATADNECKQPHHNTYMQQSDEVNLWGTNMAAIKADWAAGAVRSGCAVSIRAILTFTPATGEVTGLQLEMIDLRGGYAGAQRTLAASQQRVNGELEGQRRAADQRKADF